MDLPPRTTPEKANAAFWKAYFAKFRSGSSQPAADSKPAALNQRPTPNQPAPGNHGTSS